jgi:hypothetical protein
MPANKWLDRTQPQTLYSATLLLYLNAGINLLLGGRIFFVHLFGYTVFSAPLGIALLAAEIAGGWGIANERKWGYLLAVVAAGLLMLETLLAFSSVLLFTLIFQVALVALLLHPMSREYRRIWFR